MVHYRSCLAVPRSAPTNESAEELAARMRTITDRAWFASAKEHLKAAQARQAKYTNKGRRAYTFKPGNKVLHSSKFVSDLPPTLLPTTGSRR